MTNTKDVYIVYAKRTAIGKFGGSLSSVRVDDLLSKVFIDLKNWSNFDLLEIDDIITGCANQAGEDNRNVSRMGAVLAGLPYEVPATTVNRLCGSSLDALIHAFCRIQTGLQHAIIVAGVEGMSRAPYVMSKAENSFDRAQKIYDTSIGWRFPNPSMEKIFPLISMGETAEEVAKKLNISRIDQDQFAFESHQKASLAIQSGKFIDEIIPVKIKNGKNEIDFNQDEGPRADSSVDKLSTLKAAFTKDGTVTAGNSSSLNDGAAALLVVSGDFLKKHNLKPLLKVTSFGIRGLHPNIMGLGPVEAINHMFKSTNQKIAEFDLVELNEAFAAQALGCIRELKIDPSIVNPNGGAIALGHPLGASGARIVTTLTHQHLKNKNIKKSIASMCIGVGQGIAVGFESV